MSLRLSAGFLSLVRGSCRRRSRESSRPRHRRRRDGRRLRRRPATSLPTGSIAFASPKSSTFTVPSGRTLMLAGLRSRWMMPCSCAASSASAICFAIGSASSTGIGALRDPVRQRRPLDQLHHERADAVPLLQAVDLRDVRMVQRGQVLASRSNRASRSGSCAKASGSTLIATCRPRFVSVARSHLAHAAHADLGGDLIRAEAGASSQSHGKWLRL